MLLFYAVLMAVAIGLVLWFFFRIIAQKKWQSAGEIGSNIALLLVAGVILRYGFPTAYHYIVFQALYLHIWQVLVVAFAIPVGFYVRNLYEDGRMPLAFVYGLIALCIAIGGVFYLSTADNWKTFESHRFEEVDEIIKPDPDKLRITPIAVAHTTMVNKFNMSKFTLEREYTQPINLNGGFGYVSPVVPDGFIQTFAAKQWGFRWFMDTTENIPESERVKTTHQEFYYGKGMQWVDDIWRQLCMQNPWRFYPEIFALQPDYQNDPEYFIMVAPVVKYRYEFPCYFVPEWDGVVLIHGTSKTGPQNGTLERLTVEEAIADERLQGQRIFPMFLSEKYVWAQRYDQGYRSGLYRREGKISKPDLPGDNEQPFLMDGLDGEVYYITCAVPEGGSDALIKIFSINASNGERTVYVCDPEVGWLGPEVAIDHVKKLFPGFKWVESIEGGVTGDYRIIEPVYIPRSDGLWWKYTVTTTNYRDVIAHAVVNAANGDTVRFDSGKKFVEWVRNDQPWKAGAETEEPQSTSRVQEMLEKIDEKIDEVLGRLERLENRSQNPN